MAANKRKLDNESGERPVALSAFAARKKLWAGPTIVAKSPKPETKPLEPPPDGPKRSKRLQRKSPLAQEGELVPLLESPPGILTSCALTPAGDAVSNAVNETSGVSSEYAAIRASAVQHSTFKPTKQNYQTKPDGRVVVKLSEGERFVILGCYGIKICGGEASVYGSILAATDEVHWVYAPHCHALPVIRATETSVIELHPAPQAQSLRLLERLNPVFGKLWNESPTRVSMPSKRSKASGTFQIIFTSEDGPKKALLRDLVSPAEWNKKLAELAAPSKKKWPAVLFVCGPKSSGKSTFGKMLVNRLVTSQRGPQGQAWAEVAVLDIDPGQPEYSPPGMISLNKISRPNLSPSFCRHPDLDLSQSQLKMHAIASVTPGQDPEHYIDCVKDLFSCYQRSLVAKVPLVINTPGWIQGTGLDILVELIQAIHPSEVIYMSQEGPEETVEALKSASRKLQFSTLPSRFSEYTSRTSLHLRTMQTMSYIHLNLAPTQLPEWHSSPLTQARPWRVRYQGKDPGIVGVLCYDNQVPPSLLAETINGMILALVTIENKAAFRGLLGDPGAGETEINQLGSEMEIDRDTAATAHAARQVEPLILQTPDGIPLIPNPEGGTLDPRYSKALGLVLVRGIDIVRRELQLLTPLTEKAIMEGDPSLVLVAGKFDTPTWAYTEDLYYGHFEAAEGEEETQRPVEVLDEDTDNDSSEDEMWRNLRIPRDFMEAPWVEKLHGNQKRSVGSRVWRVRRDLGKA